MLIEGSQWFTVNYAYASKVLLDCMKNYKSYLEKSRKQGHVSKTEFNLDKMNKFISKEKTIKDFIIIVVGGTGGVAPGSAVGTVIKVVRSVEVTSNIGPLNVLAKEKTLRF